MSDRDVILRKLQHSPVCSYSFFDDPDIGHRLAARIYDLRKDGHNITSEACTNQFHRHRSRAVVYELIPEGALF